jgi:hypothetical protein
MDNFNTQGAINRVRNKDNTATNPVATLTISSWVFKLRRAENEAINKVTIEITSIVNSNK